MKILVVGARGTLGRAVVEALEPKHEVVQVGRSSGDIQADIADQASVQALFKEVGPVDAVACAAGDCAFAPLLEMTQEQWNVGLRHKLMGQVNLVRFGTPHLRDGGSFTLITGILSTEPVVSAASATLVNGAVEHFATAAAIELPRRIRINVVSPTVFEESMEAYGALFPGFQPVPVAQAAQAFVKSIEGHQTGRVYQVG